MNIVDGILDFALAPKEVHQRLADAALVEAKQDMDSGGLQIGIENGDLLAALGGADGQVGRHVRLARATSVGMN